MSDALIRADGLVKRYGGVVATDRVSLELARGEVMGVIGPNGAGKSTLVGLLSGALMSSEGRVLLAGVDVTKLPASERARRGIGRTYQIPRPFLNMSVRENLLAARLSLHPYESARKGHAACDAVLERCGLADASGQFAGELPLLRRKRLELARALALEPKVLLLDEVGAGLVDSELSELIALIRSLRSDVAGMIVIEHVLRVVRECCDRLLVINFGKMFAEGPTREVLASDEVAAVYLGTAHAPARLADGASPPASSASAAVASVLVSMLQPSAADAQARPLLELRGVHAGYGQARVLEDISLAVQPGEVVAIVGTNGAGKTTLAQVIGGIIQPTAGTLWVDGIDVTGWPPHRIARLGLAQCMEGRRIIATLTVEENLLLAARGVATALRTERLERVYALFPDLAARRSSGGTSMSGGQQQMLAIGRALMSRPRLVVFDEISLGLAPIVMDRLYAALLDLRTAGLTMLIIEQDIERALELSDTAHVMEHGRFALSGTAKACRQDPRLRELYIGAPAREPHG
jgi:ABC-type branched-subunit amino acid transport system ATPase component